MINLYALVYNRNEVNPRLFEEYQEASEYGDSLASEGGDTVEVMRLVPVIVDQEGPPYTVEGCEHCAGCGETAGDCVCAETAEEPDPSYRQHREQGQAPHFGRPTEVCGCGYPLIWVNGRWEHDAASYLWGDDHDAHAPEPTGPAREYWDREDEVTEEIVNQNQEDRA